MPGPDEFDWISSLRSLAGPEALNLADDAALLPALSGLDLVITKDALVSGIHFLPDDPMDLVARKALRVNLSDLAAKGAEPYGYLLMTAWTGHEDQDAFRAGLAHDQKIFDLTLLGGDTVSTPGPFTVSVTMLGHTPAGTMVRRSGARPGDIVQVSGTIGDGMLGLAAAQGLLALTPEDRAWLADRYRLPSPRLYLSLGGAHAAADISDGLVADVGHIAATSRVAIAIELDDLPISRPAQAWLDFQPDQAAALLQLATGGDDYELAVTAPFVLPDFTPIGRVGEGAGVAVTFRGEPVEVRRSGWRHGKDG